MAKKRLTKAEKRSLEHNSPEAVAARYGGGLVQDPSAPLPKKTDPNSPEAVSARYMKGGQHA